MQLSQEGVRIFGQITSSLRKSGDPLLKKVQTFQLSSRTANVISLTTPRLRAF